MKPKNKKLSFSARLNPSDARALRELQKITGLTQADSMRYAIRSTARAMRVVNKLEQEKKA